MAVGSFPTLLFIILISLITTLVEVDGMSVNQVIKRAAVENPTQRPDGPCFQAEVSYGNKDDRDGDFKHLDSVHNPQDCQRECQAEERCIYFTFNAKTTNNKTYGCHLKDKLNTPQYNQLHTSGPKLCPDPCFHVNVSYGNKNDRDGDFAHFNWTHNPKDCQLQCQNHTECIYWVFNAAQTKTYGCHLKNKLNTPQYNPMHTSGPRVCPDPCFESDISYGNKNDRDGDFAHFNSTHSPKDCQEQCQNHTECIYWVFNAAKTFTYGCHLKNKLNTPQYNPMHTSGPRVCPGSRPCA